MPHPRGFASDNNAGVHPRILEAMMHANRGHVVGYGDDPFTEKALSKFKEIFGEQTETFFVFNGTAANVLGLKAMTESWHSVICGEQAHMQVDECGAPEKFTGCKLLPVPDQHGKIHVNDIQKHLHDFGFEHHSQPKVISITQATELGTVYTPGEIREIAELAHSNDMYLHMDGARLSNAAVSLNCSLLETSGGAGVDVLSFGGTKNGMMFGEAIVFFQPELARNFKYIRKQGMQLGSKMRFISAQFLELFRYDLWMRNAEHSNHMAQLLKDKIAEIPQIRISRPVQANGVFAVVPTEIIKPLQDSFFFYVWDEAVSEVRWMTSFDTTESDVGHFVQEIKERVEIE
ncbi:MAG: low specificity L-threonine aldolase [Calditrichia bacterium]